jgi:putative ABC transport system substrate-binding protein
MKEAADLAIEHRLPAGAPRKIFPLNGGLLAYSPNAAHAIRRLAGLVDNVLKGAKPADLPVEQPTRFELTINLKTAKAIGLTLPPSLLARADEVIE